VEGRRRVLRVLRVDDVPSHDASARAYELELAVRCAMCLEVRDNLRLLSCLHSFCLECISTAVELAAGGKISCALCKVPGGSGARPNGERLQLAGGRALNCVWCDFCVQATTTLTAAAVSELPPDAARIAAVTQYRVVDAAASHDRAAVACQMCDIGGACVAFCETCHEFACEACVGIHRVLRAYKGHTVRLLREAATSSAGAVSLRRPICCSEHAGEVLRVFCASCNTAACLICGMVKHKGHDVVDNATAAGGMRDHLRAAVTAIAFGETKEGEFKVALAAKLAHVKEAHAARSSDINAASEALVRVVQETRDALLKSADEMLASQEAALRAQAKEV
jgi:tripartite motif-containing protein 2/3